MVEINMPASTPPKPADTPPPTVSRDDEKAMELAAKLLAGSIVEIKPQLDFTTESGFFYPAVEKVLGVKGKEVVSILESLVARDILNRDFFDRTLRCPQCRSVNLRPTTHCPKCGSGDIARGRVLEHFTCKFVGLEDEFIAKGRYICPKCKQELRTIVSDYQSLGLLRKCHDCGEIFNIPLIKWHCQQCHSLTAEDRVTEVNIYSYSLNEAKRSWLEFELKAKLALIEFLKQHGYEVTEGAIVKGRSGANHNIDILATKDDGILDYKIAIGLKVAGEKVELQEIFAFDDKAYDIGIHDKIMVVVPGLGKEAQTFANQQRIKVLQVRDLETVLASGAPKPSGKIKKEPFEFKSKSQLIQYLERLAYEVKENAEVQGRSGAKHNIDILATKDDGIITHRMAIGIEVAEEPVELNKVFAFDDKVYDIGILDKVFIAIPGLSREGRQFARRQKIRVFEVKELEPVS